MSDLAPERMTEMMKAVQEIFPVDEDDAYEYRPSGWRGLGLDEYHSPIRYGLGWIWFGFDPRYSGGFWSWPDWVIDLQLNIADWKRAHRSR
jgi:hypothetical protein